MDIKTLWGFRGDAAKLKADSPIVKARQTFKDVDEEYGHMLIGKGLAVRIDEPSPADDKQAAPARQVRAAPRSNKQTTPAEDK